MKIVFVEINNEYDLKNEMPMAYKQLKSFVLKFSEFKDSLDLQCVERVEDIPEDADIIGISATSQNIVDALETVKKIRVVSPDSLLLLGGHHISNMPETLPAEVDLGVLFEGELTFLQIVDNYMMSGKDKSALRDIRGIVYHVNGKTVINEPNELINDLDTIPFPVFEGNDQPYIFSSRGCPYDCSFCASTRYWKKVRFFSHHYVVSEIEHIIRHYPDLKTITFWDDLFIADRARFVKIVDEVDRRGINGKVQFCVAVRSNLIDEEICGLLKKMNTQIVSFGAESGCDRILKKLKGTSVSVEINQKAINLLSKYEIPLMCSFVIGSPTETKEELRETFNFIKYNMAENGMQATLNILMPLPGTDMWDYAISSNIISEPIEWNRMKLFASYKTSRLDSYDEWMEKRLKNNTFYLNEEYIPHRELLEMLKEFELFLNGPCKKENHKFKNVLKKIKRMFI